MCRVRACVLIVLLAAACGLAQQPSPKTQSEPPADSAFSDSVAAVVLNQLRDGLEGHDQSRLLSVFDRAKMADYRTFAGQIEEFFDRYDSFRVHYRIIQTMMEGARGIVLVDFDMEETPHDSNVPPRRKSAQLRFELERGSKGWKMVDFTPRDFFS